MARWIPALVVLAAMPRSSAPGAEGPGRGECVIVGRPARLGGCVHRTDATGAARLFFRDAGGRHWYFVEATNENGCASGVIPAPGTGLDSVAYYVEITTADGSVERSRERTARVVRQAGQCVPGRMLPSSSVEPASVGATAGAPLTPGGFGPRAVRGGAPAWMMGGAAAAAAGGAAVALRSESPASDEPPAAPREPPAAPSTPAPPPAPTATPEPPPEPPARRATPTPEPVVEPPSEPPPPPPPPAPTPKPTSTPKPEPTPKPTKTPKPRGGGDDLTAGSLHWRSDLQAPGAQGRLVIAHDRVSAAEAPAGYSQGTLELEPGENRLEIAVRGARRAAVWRLTLGHGLIPGTLRVLAGTVTVEGDDTLVLHLRGQPFETAVVAFRSP
jgi:hypothetical protein